MSYTSYHTYFSVNEFEQKCNLESVSLERVEEVQDVEWLQQTLADFHDKTGSVVARYILDNWTQEIKHFIKVSLIYFSFTKILRISLS